MMFTKLKPLSHEPLTQTSHFLWVKRDEPTPDNQIAEASHSDSDQIIICRGRV